DGADQRIPRYFGIVLEKPGGLDDLSRIGGGGQDLRDQRVGVQRDWSDELQQLILGGSNLLRAVRLAENRPISQAGQDGQASGEYKARGQRQAPGSFK